MTLSKLLKMSVPVAAMLSAAAGGCRSKKPCCPDDMQPGDKMMAADEQSDVTRLADMQIAAGARTDATLRPYHFNNTTLNSLGRAKLDLMAEGGEEGDKSEMVVYLDFPNTQDADKSANATRQDQVTQYLMSRGLAENAFRLETGYNPANTMSAVSANATSAAPEAAAAAAAPTGGGAGGYGTSGMGATK